MQPEDGGDAVAVIGLAGRFPGARDVRQYWANLAAGVDSITVVGDPHDHEPGARSWHVRAEGVVADIELFDADFFAVPPAEAAWMDPQQRLFLECAWLALEDAGCDPARLSGAVSVYAGANMNSYVLERLGRLGVQDPAQFMQILVGNEKDFLATRVAYKLDLRGEAVTVQSACSTSLVAVHLACQSLLGGQSDLALAGGVSIRVPQLAGYTYAEGLISSPDGRCRPFDHRARGTVPGSGLGVVVLKRLEDALRDRDHCYALLRGSWINNDGRDKVGFTAPAVEGQAQVVARALAMAGVPAETIRYVETHGTGTPLGDPIELEALRRAFGSVPRRACALGAVKASIGHLDNAAGVAGLIKVALALEHRLLPPAVNFERPHPALDLDNSPFYVNTAPEPWEAAGAPRRAAISSFGVGGTNVHAVLEEPPARVRAAAARPVQIVTLSARTDEALQAQATSLAEALELDPALEARDVAYTRNAGRRHFTRRRYVVAAERAELVAALRGPGEAAEARGAAPLVAFLFAGPDAARVGLARALAAHEPCFREALELGLARAESHGVHALRRLLGLVGPAGGPTDEALLARPEQALPSLLAVECALAELWRAWGVTPSAVMGHGCGELAALCVAGAVDPDDAMAWAVERGRQLGRLPPARRLALPLSEPEAGRWLDETIVLDSVEGERRIVLSGPVEALERVAAELQGTGRAGEWLPGVGLGSLAWPAPPFGVERAGRRPAGSAVVRCVSGLTGDWLDGAPAGAVAHWTAQAGQPTRFAAGLRRLREAGYALFVEIGPGRSLAGLVRGALGDAVTLGASLSGDPQAPTADWRTLLDTLGRLWTAGARVDWEQVERAQQGWRVPLPGYPFARQRHWIDVPAGAGSDVPSPPPPPAPDAAPEPVEAGAPFRRQAERLLVEIWGEVLGRPVGVHENVFELGADSLTATRVLARLEPALPVRVTLEQLLMAPTIAELVELLEPGAPAARPAEPAGDSRVLSYAQEWLWTQQSLAPTSPAYHLPLAVRLRGPFDGAAFHQALAHVAARQEALRTRFAVEDGLPLAVVQPTASPSVPLVDLSLCPPERGERLARRVAAAEIARLFDLAQAPPWRAAITRLGPDDHVVLFVLHHIIADGWSMGVLVNEVTTAYVARRSGTPAPSPPLALQYRQYARQQRERLAAEGAELVAYWKRQLADVPPLLTLAPRPRPPVKSYRGGRHAFRIEPALAGSLAELARREQATLFMVTLAAYQALLFRLGGQEDFCVGAPTAGRSRRELEPIIGCFIDTLPLRADLRGDPPFVELLQRVRRTTLDAFAHQGLPFGRLVQELRPPRSPSFTPLFQVIFDFNSTPPATPPQWPELAVEPFGAPQPTAKTDLITDLWRGSDGELLGAVEYDRALFDAADVERFAAAFVTLLGAVAGAAETRVSALPLESEEERARRAEAARAREALHRGRLATIKGGRRTHVTDSH